MISNPNPHRNSNIPIEHSSTMGPVRDQSPYSLGTVHTEANYKCQDTRRDGEIKYKQLI